MGVYSFEAKEGVLGEKENLIVAKNLTRSDIAYVQMGRLWNHVRRNGWLQSAIEKRPLDAKGNPIPWYTYPCLRFLSDRINAQMNVFEYGSGHSTLWWASRVSSVTACEHNKAFFDEIQPKLPANVNYLYRDAAEGGYAALAEEQGRKFDVVVIDGADRVECAKHAPQALTDDGVIVFDNSNLRRFAEGFAHLAEQGFRRLDFFGHGPIWVREWATSVFYRSGNCLKI